jgi:hypothetical protein
MSRKDLVLDFETMGSNAQRCAVVDCSTFVFEWDRFGNTPYTFEELLDGARRYKLSVKDQVKNYGFQVEQDTLDFWMQQTEEVQARVRPSKSDLTVPEFVVEFMADLSDGPKIEYWWSRNNTFDPTVLWRLMWTQQTKYHINEYLMHWRVRDIKTWIDAKFDFTTPSGFIPIADVNYWNKTFKQHDSTHDVAADVLRLQAIWRAENDMEQITR